MNDIDVLIRDLKKYGNAEHDCALLAEDALAIATALEAAWELEARAERLTEALHHVKDKLETVAAIRGAHGTFAGTYLIVTEALNPTAAQEGKEAFWPKLPESGGPDWTGHD